MRYLIAFSLVLVATLLGCQKQQPVVQTTELGPEIRSIESLAPEQPAVASADMQQPVRPRVRTVPDAPTALAASAVTTPEPASDTYVITADDKGGFYGIARKVLGDQRRWKEIAELNPGVDPTKLRVGQTLNMPAR